MALCLQLPGCDYPRAPREAPWGLRRAMGGLNPHDLCRIATRQAKVVAANATSSGDLAFRHQVRVTTLSPVPLSQSPGHSLQATATHNGPPVASAEAQITRC